MHPCQSSFKKPLCSYAFKSLSHRGDTTPLYHTTMEGISSKHVCIMLIKPCLLQALSGGLSLEVILWAQCADPRYTEKHLATCSESLLPCPCSVSDQSLSLSDCEDKEGIFSNMDLIRKIKDGKVNNHFSLLITYL